VSQYADDTSIIPRNGRSVWAAVECFKLFGRMSGAVINIDKCAAVAIAGFSDWASMLPDIRRVEAVKITGYILGAGDGG